MRHARLIDNPSNRPSPFRTLIEEPNSKALRKHQIALTEYGGQEWGFHSIVDDVVSDDRIEKEDRVRQGASLS